MSGVAVIRYLLANNAALVALVPATRIMAGDLPIKVVLPAISVTQISGTPRNTLAMNGGKLHSDRVQVTALVKGADQGGGGYSSLDAILSAVFDACPYTRGTVNGIDVDSTKPDIEGPDLSDPATSLLSRSRDFIVRHRGAVASADVIVGEQSATGEILMESGNEIELEVQP